jgi:hypothetical protein
MVTFGSGQESMLHLLAWNTKKQKKEGKETKERNHIAKREENS